MFEIFLLLIIYQEVGLNLFFLRASLSTPGYTGTEYTGRESRTNINTGLQDISGTGQGVALRSSSCSCSRSCAWILVLSSRPRSWSLVAISIPISTIIIIVAIAIVTVCFWTASVVSFSNRTRNIVFLDLSPWSCTHGSVSGSSERSGTRIASVLGFSRISLTCWIWFPGSVWSTGWPDLGSNGTLEGAESPWVI